MNNYYVHETAIIDDGAKIGSGTKIWHFSHVCSNAVLGKNVTLGQNVFVGDNVVVGEDCKVQNNVSLYEGVTLGDGVFCGPSMVFTNVYNPRSQIERKSEFRPTVVSNGVTFGANCTVVCGVEIGEYAFIGAGALVNENVKPYALSVGVPARQIGWMSQFGDRINLPVRGNGEYICPHTNQTYILDNGDMHLT